MIFNVTMEMMYMEAIASHSGRGRDASNASENEKEVQSNLHLIYFQFCCETAPFACDHLLRTVCYLN